MKETIRNYDSIAKRDYLKNVICTIGLSNGRRYLTIDDIDLMNEREVRAVFRKVYRNLGEMDFGKLYRELEEDTIEWL